MKEYSADAGTALPDTTDLVTLTTVLVPVADSFAHLSLAQIAPSLTNPRKHFNPARLAELAESIRASGVHQPILVRPLPGHRVADTTRDITHEIVSGERRYRASQDAGQATIPAMIRQLDDDQVLEIQLVENLQRDDLTELEEAEGYQALCTATGITVDKVGDKIGKSRSYVYARLKLLDLSTECRQALREGTIDASRALLIARIPDTALQLRALKDLTRINHYGDPVYSARAAQSLVQNEYMLKLASARFKITDAALLPGVGTCKECPKRTGANPDLFSDVKGADVCTDPVCFHKKEEAHTAAELSEAHKSGQTVIAGREAKAIWPSQYNKLEGYLRLDDARDAPGDKTLRKLLGKAIDQGDVKPSLIVNPHKEGDLVAVLPAATVASLLKAKGNTEAATTVAKDLNRDKRQAADDEKRKLKEAYEQAWRSQLMLRTYAAIVKANFGGATSLSDAVLRILCRRYAHNLNKDRAKVVVNALGLGKIAPQEGLRDHINTCTRPEHVLLLLVMHADSEYMPWLGEDKATNADLLQVAADYKVNVPEVQADVKASMKPKVTKAAKAEKPADPTSTEGPAAQANTTRDRAKPTLKPGAKSAPARRPKMSAAEAQAGIAAAMQDVERPATAQAEAAPSAQVDNRAWPWPFDTAAP